MDDAGKVVREVKVTSEPEALLAVLKNPAYHFKRIGLEAGPRRASERRFLSAFSSRHLDKITSSAPDGMMPSKT